MPDITPDVERELAALDDALAGRRVAPDLADLGELALALRDERPAPSPSFGAALDEKLARGFRDPGPRRRASGRRWWNGWLAPALATTATVMLVAVIAFTAGDDADEVMQTGGSASGGRAELDRPSSGAAEQGKAADSGATFAAPDATGSVPPAPAPGSPRSDGRAKRKVERSASLTLAARPRDIDGVSARIQDVTRRQGGFVASSTISSSPGGGEGTFELRIPTRNLDAAMAELSRLGSVRERAQSAQDITAQAVSARSRLKDARTERASLLRQLAAAATPAETESIRRRLDLVSREIESRRADLRRVNNRAAFATVAVTLVADRSVGSTSTDDNGTWTPADAADDALRVLEVTAGVALIALAIALPLALLAALAGLATRWTRRRRREQALDAV